MKTFQFADRILIVGEAAQWDQLLTAVTKDTPATVVDLRTFVEVGEQPVPRTPEGWGYRRLPITGATVSEQDLDVLRREFFRRPQTVIVGPNASRSRLLAAAALSRLEQGGWNGGDRAEVETSHGEDQLRSWLTDYLVRHGFEKAPEKAETPRSTKAKGPQEKGTEESPAPSPTEESATKPASKTKSAKSRGGSRKKK